MEWISVEDGLPEYNVEVLVALKDTYSPRTKDIITTAYRNYNGGWRAADYGIVLDVAPASNPGKTRFVFCHWMPLPEPPVNA